MTINGLTCYHYVILWEELERNSPHIEPKLRQCSECVNFSLTFKKKVAKKALKLLFLYN